jgi:hypothetical protein
MMGMLGQEEEKTFRKSYLFSREKLIKSFKLFIESKNKNK